MTSLLGACTLCIEMCTTHTTYTIPQNCVASLKVLPLANDVTTTKSLCRLAWQPNGGKVLAVPVESEVKIYERMSWKPKLSLADDYHQKVNTGLKTQVVLLSLRV